MNKSVIFLALCAPWVLAGCGGEDKKAAGSKPAVKVEQASVAPGEEANLFPLTVGNQWVYDVETVLQTQRGTQSSKQVATFKVERVEPVSGGKRALISVTNDGKIVESSWWIVTNKGIYQATSGNPAVPFTPPQTILPFPITAGQKFTWNGTGKRNVGPSGPMKVESKVLGPMEIDTGAGRMSGIAVESKSRWTVNKVAYNTVSTVWWVPKVGIGRFAQAIATTGAATSVMLRLKSHSLKP